MAEKHITVSVTIPEDAVAELYQWAADRIGGQGQTKEELRDWTLDDFIYFALGRGKMYQVIGDIFDTLASDTGIHFTLKDLEERTGHPAPNITGSFSSFKRHLRSQNHLKGLGDPFNYDYRVGDEGEGSRAQYDFDEDVAEMWREARRQTSTDSGEK